MWYCSLVTLLLHCRECSGLRVWICNEERKKINSIVQLLTMGCPSPSRSPLPCLHPSEILQVPAFSATGRRLVCVGLDFIASIHHFTVPACEGEGARSACRVSPAWNCQWEGPCSLLLCLESTSCSRREGSVAPGSRSSPPAWQPALCYHRDLGFILHAFDAQARALLYICETA